MSIRCPPKRVKSTIQKILFIHLDWEFFKLAQTKTRYSHFDRLKQEVEVLLSVMAYAGQQGKNAIENAFGAATKILEVRGLQLLEKGEFSFAALDRSLEQLKPLAKPQLLKACAASVLNDQKISSVEIELLRAFSDVHGCPMPPVIL